MRQYLTLESELYKETKASSHRGVYVSESVEDQSGRAKGGKARGKERSSSIDALKTHLHQFFQHQCAQRSKACENVYVGKATYWYRA